jgi:hypothetical protein
MMVSMSKILAPSALVLYNRSREVKKRLVYHLAEIQPPPGKVIDTEGNVVVPFDYDIMLDSYDGLVVAGIGHVFSDRAIGSYIDGVEYWSGAWTSYKWGVLQLY